MAGSVMDRAELERAREKFESEVRTRFEGAAIDKVELLQYGDDPEIEPGELFARVIVAAPDGVDQTDQEACGQALEEFHDAHRAAIRAMQREMKNRATSGFTLEFTLAGRAAAPEAKRGPVIRMKSAGGRGPFASGADPSLTPVMARLGAEDLEILDTLIAVGIAASRAEAVRWALARIRERPAYEQIRARSREIEDLKSQF
jgi:Arc/MetJ-type ribon-helix-helix transcriptional regulator